VSVTNQVGSITSAAATVTLASVPIAPTISVSPRSQEVALGDAVTFTVGAEGTAPFTYRWHKNGVPIAGATSAALTIAVGTLGDAGSYSVAVSTARAS
jgi:hypothetical protein